MLLIIYSIGYILSFIFSGLLILARFNVIRIKDLFFIILMSLASFINLAIVLILLINNTHFMNKIIMQGNQK
jgi:hypothetical protein